MTHSQLQYKFWHSCPVITKDALNSSVFSCRLSAIYDDDVLTESGRAFQARAYDISYRIEYRDIEVVSWHILIAIITPPKNQYSAQLSNVVANMSR